MATSFPLWIWQFFDLLTLQVPVLISIYTSSLGRFLAIFIGNSCFPYKPGLPEIDDKNKIVVIGEISSREYVPQRRGSREEFVRVEHLSDGIQREC